MKALTRAVKSILSSVEKVYNVPLEYPRLIIEIMLHCYIQWVSWWKGNHKPQGAEVQLKKRTAILHCSWLYAYDDDSYRWGWRHNFKTGNITPDFSLSADILFSSNAVLSSLLQGYARHGSPALLQHIQSFLFWSRSSHEILISRLCLNYWSLAKVILTLKMQLFGENL